MLNQLPYITTTTELQRTPSILSKTKKDRYRVITKGSKQIGVYLPMEMFLEWEEEMLKHQNTKVKKSYSVSPKIRSILSGIDPVQFQREIRKEY